MLYSVIKGGGGQKFPIFALYNSMCTSGVGWHGPSRAMARPLDMLLGPRWGQGPTFNILISGSAL